MQTSEPQPTRDALIDAGLRLFGENGFAATSTRQIAAHAGANIGSISYYFGSKDGLRRACAEHVADEISRMAAGALGAHEPATPEEAEWQLEMLIRHFVDLLAQPRARYFVAFVLREIMHPGEILDHVFDRFAAPIHRRMCRIWGVATGTESESEATRIAVFAMLGQILYFRIAQPFVLKRLDWAEFGAREARLVANVLTRNLNAAIAAARRG